MTGPIEGAGGQAYVPPLQPSPRRTFADMLAAQADSFALGALASVAVRTGKPGAQATPVQAGEDPVPANGVVPLNPDRSVGRPRTPGTSAVGGSNGAPPSQLQEAPVATLPGTGQHPVLLASVGASTPIPTSVWAGAPGTPLHTQPTGAPVLAAAGQLAAAQASGLAMHVVSQAIASPPGQAIASAVMAGIGARAARHVAKEKATGPVTPEFAGGILHPSSLRAASAAKGAATLQSFQPLEPQATTKGQAAMPVQHSVLPYAVRLQGMATGFGVAATVPGDALLGVARTRFERETPLDLSLHPVVAWPIAAMGRVVGPPVQAFNKAVVTATKLSFAVGGTTLATSLATGTLTVSKIVVGQPGNSPAVQAITRVANQPVGSTMLTVSGQVPFTPASAGMRTTAYLTLLHKPELTGPYVFPAVLAPGQRGVPPWVNVADGRLTVTNQYNIGWNILGAGLATGNENFFHQRLYLLNLPRVNTPISRLEALPSEKRLTLADLQVGAAASPVSVLQVDEYGLGQIRAARGTLYGIGAAKLMVGTKGIDPSFKPGLDVTQFASVAPNPSFNPKDPVYQALEHVVRQVTPSRP